MAHVYGIGGIFFKSIRKEALQNWYQRHLGFKFEDHGSVDFRPADYPVNSLNVFAPFPDTTDYFAPSTKEFMINLIVDDVQAVLAAAIAGGAVQVGDSEHHDYGDFAWFLDPEGNKIELWRPK